MKAPARLRELLSCERERLERVRGLMASERALPLGSPELEACISAKHEALDGLEQATRERLDWLQAQGVSADRDGILDLLGDTAEASAVLGSLEALHEAARHCQQDNLELARLTRGRQAFFERAAERLGMGGATATPDYYAPSFATAADSGGNGRLLGSA